VHVGTAAAGSPRPEAGFADSGSETSHSKNYRVACATMIFRLLSWRHRLSFDWDYRDVGLTLGNTFYSGYHDHNTAFNPNTGELLPARDVSSYSLWDLSGSWSPDKQFKLRAGIQNLFNTQPPFSNQGYYFLATYDPSYTDPRGRTYYLSASYSFR
jgi:iron complex outermembrane receptor protein